MAVFEQPFFLKRIVGARFIGLPVFRLYSSPAWLLRRMRVAGYRCTRGYLV